MDTDIKNTLGMRQGNGNQINRFGGTIMEQCSARELLHDDGVALYPPMEHITSCTSGQVFVYLPWYRMCYTLNRILHKIILHLYFIFSRLISLSWALTFHGRRLFLVLFLWENLLFLIFLFIVLRCIHCWSINTNTIVMMYLTWCKQLFAVARCL